MANAICSQSLRSIGAACGGDGVVSAAATKSNRAAIADCFSSRKSWSPPAHGHLGNWKSLQKVHRGGAQFSRHIPLRRRASASPTTNHSIGFFGALTCTQDDLSEKPCAQNSAGPGSSTLEKWLERYLTEIVKHLPEAPFLQFVPEYNSSCGERQSVSEELFEKPESWRSVQESLRNSAPDGIILVHRLDLEALSECCMSDVKAHDEESSRPNTSLQDGGSSTDVWGVLVQGCKTRCNACYILKTTRVASSTGILTHFCLSRAKCFGPSIRSQLQSTWLL